MSILQLAEYLIRIEYQYQNNLFNGVFVSVTSPHVCIVYENSIIPIYITVCLIQFHLPVYSRDYITTDKNYS